MIAFKILKNRTFKVFLTFLGLLLIAVISLFLESNLVRKSVIDSIALQLEKSSKINLREISGMYRDPKKMNSPLFVVGDSFATIAIANFEDGKIVENKYLDFSQAIEKRFSVCDSSEVAECRKMLTLLTSQWEAIAVDGIGNIFVLHEKLASILVLGSEAKEIKARINLQRFKEIEQERIKKQKNVDDNALGEGLLLLKNGHILIAKEKKPPSLIEFGPQGDSPSGYQSELAVIGAEVFPLSSDKMRYVPLKVWMVPKDLEGCDMSELAADEGGRLHFLSQQCQLIGMIDRLDLNESSFKIQKNWLLPEKLISAEAFIVLGEGEFLVGQDLKSLEKDNLHYVFDKNFLQHLDDGITPAVAASSAKASVKE